MEDQEKSRKRPRDHDQVDAANGLAKSKPRSATGLAAPVAGGPVVPSAEEAEQFFEILRKMHAAVRYFDKKINVDGDRDRGFSGRLKEALETGRTKLATPTTSEGDHGKGREKGTDDEEAAAAEKNSVIDLNSEPDEEIAEIGPVP